MIDVKEKHYQEAEHLWREVFEHDPAQVTAGLNLAIMECAAGKSGEVKVTLERVLEFSPDEGRARSMLLA